MPVHISKAKLPKTLLAQLKQVSQAQLSICPRLVPAQKGREKACLALCKCVHILFSNKLNSENLPKT